MKKIYLILSFVIICIHSAFSQTNSINSTGNVGIGTTTPDNLLQLLSTSNPTIKISNTTGAAGSTASLFFGLSTNSLSNNFGSRIQSVRTTIGTSDLVFSTYNGTTLAEGFRLFSNGYVGIGTATPDALLTIGSTTNRGTMNIEGTSSQTPLINLVDNQTSGRTFSLYSGLSSAGYFNILDQTSHTYRFTIDSTGSVGIGTATPGSKLEVSGDISSQKYATLSSYRAANPSYTSLFLGGAIKANSNGTYTVIGDGASNYFGAIRMDNSGANAGAINFYTGAATTDATAGQNYPLTNTQLGTYLSMTIVGGNVGIGTANPGSFKLAVNGNVHAKQVNVDLTGWGDYVFNKDYSLRSLADVKTYIEQNHHLPEIPSAAEVEKNGVNLGEMNKLLVKKVEELTLYLLEKDKEIKEQGEKMKLLEEKLNQLLNTNH